MREQAILCVLNNTPGNCRKNLGPFAAVPPSEELAIDYTGPSVKTQYTPRFVRTPHPA